MQRSMVRFRFACIALVLCFALAGCGVSFPYYTLEGNQEGRVVVIHVTKDRIVKIPTTSGFGGLGDDVSVQIVDEKTYEVEKGDAVVTMVANGPLMIVKKVEYDGREIKFHEPVF